MSKFNYRRDDPPEAVLPSAYGNNLRRRLSLMTECPFCAQHGADPMMPYHDASDRCESGKHPHCTCDTCF